MPKTVGWQSVNRLHKQNLGLACLNVASASWLRPEGETSVVSDRLEASRKRGAFVAPAGHVWGNVSAYTLTTAPSSTCSFIFILCQRQDHPLLLNHLLALLLLNILPLESKSCCSGISAIFHNDAQDPRRRRFVCAGREVLHDPFDHRPRVSQCS